MQVGTIIGMPVSGLLADTELGWTLIFYVMAGLMVVTAVMWQFLTASTPGEHRWITHEEKEYIESGLNIGNEVCTTLLLDYFNCTYDINTIFQLNRPI